MKSTGIVRQIDELGRIVLPKELRKRMDITSRGDSIEIFVDDDCIILKKYHPSCIFCGNLEKLIYYNGKMVCKKCVAKLKDTLD